MRTSPESYRLIGQRFSVLDEVPPRAFLAALGALLPDDALTDDLQHEGLIASLTGCERPSGGESTSWVTTGLVGHAIFHVRATAADGWWAFDHHLDQRMQLESFIAWIRPVAALRSISLVSASLQTPQNQDFVPHVKWALNFAQDVVTLPYEGFVDTQTEETATNLVEAIRDARLFA